MPNEKELSTQLNAALTFLGIAPTDETREKMRTVLDRTWRAGFITGQPTMQGCLQAQLESPYREGL